MATRRSQRIGIWIIAAVMLLGTVGGFVAMIVAPANEAKDAAALEAEQKEYSKLVEERQKKVDAQANELSTKYFQIFSPFADRVGEFEAEGIDELSHEDLVVGEGEEVKDDTVFVAYYIGWTPNGNIFDQSINGDKLKEPFAIDGPATASVIEGWQKGLIGMKIGGVRELTIPYNLAYGEDGQGEDIPGKTPLKFIIMAIDKPKEIPMPELPPLLKKEYAKYGL